MTTWLATAERIARSAHAGQVDKSGKPYIYHPERVARITSGITPAPEAVAAAWLHDVLEDTHITSADLRDQGIPEAVIEVVELMTRTSGQTISDYILRLRQHPLAYAVKVADLVDNSSPTRLDALPAETSARLRQKYYTMWKLLIEGG